MFCEQCGANLQEGATFCNACGSPVESQEEVESVYTPPVQPEPVINTTVNNYYPEQKKASSVAGWIFRPFLALIPIAGPIIYIIMLFKWANDKTMEVSFNNWAKAQLWLMLIGVGLGVIGVIIALLIAGGLSSYMYY